MTLNDTILEAIKGKLIPMGSPNHPAANPSHPHHDKWRAALQSKKDEKNAKGRKVREILYGKTKRTPKQIDTSDHKLHKALENHLGGSFEHFESDPKHHVTKEGHAAAHLRVTHSYTHKDLGMRPEDMDDTSENHSVTAVRKNGKYEIHHRMMREEVELEEGRQSQQHPIEGHPYHSKSNAELHGIIKDAGETARIQKGMSSEGKYLDQQNDASTVLGFRQRATAVKGGSIPDWYVKKYLTKSVKEEVELNENASHPAHQYLVDNAHKSVVGDPATAKIQADPQNDGVYKVHYPAVKMGKGKKTTPVTHIVYLPKKGADPHSPHAHGDFETQIHEEVELDEAFKETEQSKRDAIARSAREKVRQILANRKPQGHPDDVHNDGGPAADRKFRRQEMGEGVISKVIKKAKRIKDGWWTPTTDLDGKDGGPKGIKKRNMNYDDDTVKLLGNRQDKINPHSPAGLQQKVLNREIKKRKLGEEVQLDETFADQGSGSTGKSKEDKRIAAALKAKNMGNQKVEVHYHGTDGYGVSNNGKLVKHHDTHESAVAHAKTLSDKVRDMTENTELDEGNEGKNGLGGWTKDAVLAKKQAGFIQPGGMTSDEIGDHIRKKMAERGIEIKSKKKKA